MGAGSHEVEYNFGDLGIAGVGPLKPVYDRLGGSSSWGIW